MAKPKEPEMKLYMDKRVSVQLNANRHVVGTLRGYDPFSNLVLVDAAEMEGPAAAPETGSPIGTIVIRGNSVVKMESLERLPSKR